MQLLSSATPARECRRFLILCSQRLAGCAVDLAFKIWVHAAARFTWGVKVCWFAVHVGCIAALLTIDADIRRKTLDLRWYVAHLHAK